MIAEIIKIHLADVPDQSGVRMKGYIKGRIKVNGVVCKSPDTKIDTTKMIH